MGLAEDVMNQYPSLSFLLNDPEVGQLLLAAVDPNQGFDPTTFEARLQQTNWWMSRSQTERQWEVAKATDPGQARQQRNTYAFELADMSRRMGIMLTEAQLIWWTEWGIQSGLSPTHPQVIRTIIDAAPAGTQGSIGVDARRIQNLYEGQYLMPISFEQSMDSATRVAQATDSVEAIERRLSDMAKGLWPHLAERFEAGETPAQIVEPYRAIVARELELGASSNVDVMGNPTWRQLMGIQNPNTGEVRMMTESEVLKMARSDTRWWQTANGRQSEAAMANSLLGLFGQRERTGV